MKALKNSFKSRSGFYIKNKHIRISKIETSKLFVQFRGPLDMQSFQMLMCLGRYN